MKVRIAIDRLQGPDGHYSKLRIYDRRGRKVDDHRGTSAEQAERKAAKGGES